MMLTQPPAEVRRHIQFKASVGEVKPEIAERMLAALDDGADPDYQALLEAATFLPPPSTCFHTAALQYRDSILKDGLRARLPEAGDNWGSLALGQPQGVYVAAVPDEIGMWSSDPRWDVWEVDVSTLAWHHDRLNPGCWVLDDDVPAARVRLWGTRGESVEHG